MEAGVGGEAAAAVEEMAVVEMAAAAMAAVAMAVAATAAVVAAAAAMQAAAIEAAAASAAAAVVATLRQQKQTHAVSASGIACGARWDGKREEHSCDESLLTSCSGR